MSHPMPYPEDRAVHQPAPVPQPAPVSPAVAQATVPIARTPIAPPVTAAPLAKPAALTRPPDQPGGPPPGPAGDQPWDRTGPSGRASRLRIGWHTVPRSGLRRVAVTPPTPAGLLLGHDQARVPVPVRLFAPDPVRVTLVGGVWAAQLMIFRAFSVGARAVVVTTEPQAWAGFGERATGRRDRLTVVTGELEGPIDGTAQTPLLTVYDLGVSGPMTSPARGSWHTQLTVLRQLHRPGVATVQEAGLVVLQRLDGDEAALAVAARRLRPPGGQLLQQMNDDMMALIGDGDDRYLFLHQTAIEQQYLGPPRR